MGSLDLEKNTAKKCVRLFLHHTQFTNSAYLSCNFTQGTFRRVSNRELLEQRTLSSQAGSDEVFTLAVVILIVGTSLRCLGYKSKLLVRGS